MGLLDKHQVSCKIYRLRFKDRDTGGGGEGGGAWPPEKT